MTDRPAPSVNARFNNILEAAKRAISPDEYERSSNLWRTPFVWPHLGSDKPAPDVMKVAGIMRLETGRYRVQVYEFQYPWEPYHDPRTGDPMPIERVKAVEDRYRSDSGSERQMPSRWDATEWLLQQYENPVDDVQHLYDACGLHYRGEHHQYWYGYRDLRTGSVGYGFADMTVLESLIWMSKTNSKLDRDRLHELLLAPTFNGGPMDRYHFLASPASVFTDYPEA